MTIIRHLISFALLATCHMIGKIFYTPRIHWVGEDKEFENIRLLALMNHTSLFEPLFCAALPLSFLWKQSRNWAAPGADKTLERPLVGSFYKLLSPNMISISRKRDKTWRKFMEIVGEKKALVVIAPEGRMLRRDGLDKEGKPMSIKGGIVDILEVIDEGKMLIAYSGGLHHVQAPGEFTVHLFKKINMTLELIDIKEYKDQFSRENYRKEIMADLEARKLKNTPHSE